MMRKILGLNELTNLKDYIGADRYARLHANRNVYFALGGNEYLLAFHFCDLHSTTRRDEKIYIYCSGQDLIYICDNRRCMQLANAVDETLAPYAQLLEFLVALTTDDVYAHEKIEDKIIQLEDELLTKKRPDEDSPAKIIALRRELLNIKRYYEQLSIIADEFSENNCCLFSADLQKRYTSLYHRIDYLLNSVLHLREYITQVREAYQAQIDIEQNQIMKTFTIISAIFLPLMLIVGWYGMNLQMPEFGWTFGYIYVILLSLFVCIVCFAVFKLKRWY